MRLHVLGDPEHDLTIFGFDYFGVSEVCNKNFVAIVTRELTHKIA